MTDPHRQKDVIIGRISIRCPVGCKSASLSNYSPSACIGGKKLSIGRIGGGCLHLSLVAGNSTRKKLGSVTKSLNRKLFSASATLYCPAASIISTRLTLSPPRPPPCPTPCPRPLPCLAPCPTPCPPLCPLQCPPPCLTPCPTPGSNSFSIIV